MSRLPVLAASCLALLPAAGCSESWSGARDDPSCSDCVGGSSGGTDIDQRIADGVIGVLVNNPRSSYSKAIQALSATAWTCR